MSAQHKSSVQYSEEGLPDINLPAKGWTFDRNSEGWVGVSGRCPACLGRASGPPLPKIDPDVKGDGEPLLYVDQDSTASAGHPRAVYTVCRCGFEHHNPGVKGCGRHWIVRVTEGDGK